MSDLYTFWDEEKKRSELHFLGHVLYGSNEATMAVMFWVMGARRRVERLRAAREKEWRVSQALDDVLYEEGPPFEPKDDGHG